MTPRIVKVTVRPRVKASEYWMAFFWEPSEYPLTYPMTSGIMARTQGLALEMTPARKHAGKATHP